MTILMGQEKKRISERLEWLDAERKNGVLNSMSWKSQRVFWHDSRVKRLKPRSWRERGRRTLQRRSEKSTERKANDRCRPYR